MSDGASKQEWQRLHTRVAAYALCLDDQKRLLLCRIAPGYPAEGRWTLPGGGIDFGEHPADAVVRELSEETGLIGSIDRLCFVDSLAREAQRDSTIGPWHAIRIVYQVTLAGGTLRHETDESTDMAAWFSRSELDEAPIVDLVKVARRYLDGDPLPR